ncbi:MAG: N-acetylneuraminate synthase family protein [Deltaproteobacteria bacterium]|nr:N-acetylneuraminate synthase family protein [Deltaproteobacteria bacterium]
MEIEGHRLDKKILIVAEIGGNHEGDFGAAKEMVEAAATTGVDAVKFQTYRAAKIVTSQERARFEHYRRFELAEEEFAALAALARERGLVFLSTPFDRESADFLDPLVPAFKIASGDLPCLPLVAHVAAKGKPVLLSTGMSEVVELQEAVRVIEQACPAIPLEERLVLLHCVSSYPTMEEDAHLRGIPFLRETFGVPVGYSDHTLGILACTAAAALGACVLEKHFTLQREGRTFPDHILSADVAVMTELVRQVRAVERLLGEYGKRPLPCEETRRVTMRRSLAAARPIMEGEILTEEALTFLRPATGLPPRLEGIVGRRARRALAAGVLLTPEDVE